MNPKRLVVQTLLGMFICFPVVGLADQTDQRLDELFLTLQNSNNEQYRIFPILISTFKILQKHNEEKNNIIACRLTISTNYINITWCKYHLLTKNRFLVKNYQIILLNR
jgi:hypothetical protein